VAKSSKSNSGKSKRSKSATRKTDVTAVQEDVVEVAAESVALDDPATDIPDDEDGLNMDDVVAQPDLEIEIVEDVVVPEPEVGPVAEPDTNRSGGFVPLLLGGVAAGAIGFGIATYFPKDRGLDDLTAQVAALEAQLADIPTVDLSGLEQQIADEATQSGERVSELSASIESGLAALDTRLVEVEKRPGADGTLSEVALAAYQRELQDLRDELNAQQEGVMTAAAQAEADLAAARAEAEQLEQQAVAAAEAASARAAVNRIGTAVETGAPFEDALSGLIGDVPAALTAAAASGVATSAELAADFPAAARAALATARSEGVSDDANGIGGFFRSQFDVRSTAPREGSDPDAILSRAEAAVKEGRVSDALAEIGADVLDAIATLSETYN